MIDRQALATYRQPNREDYPELAGYSRTEIYRDSMGGGALYLAVRMAWAMHLKEGDLVLDLGCGKGETSIFLARNTGAQVMALDLWTPATYLSEKFAGRGYRNRIPPLNLDVTGRLPFAESYFDAIFCMNSLSFYGGSVAFLDHLLKYLKPGGEFCAGMETLNEEFTPEQLENPPAVYHYTLPGTDINVWDDDFSKMHSPAWWEALFKSSGLLDVLECRELEDATVLYEDQVLYNVERAIDPEDVERSIAQIAWGREHRPYKTLFTIAARKL